MAIDVPAAAASNPSRGPHAGGHLSPSFYAAAFEHSIVAVMLAEPDGSILAANPAACALFKRTEAEICALGRTGLVDPASHQLPAFLNEPASHGTVRVELVVICGDGTRVPVEASTHTFTDDRGVTRLVVFVRDLTAQMQEEPAQHLHRLSFFDGLTGLPSRRLLVDRLRQSVHASSGSHMRGAVLFLDLDDFKVINDTKGHAAGDDLLREVAVRLRSCVHEADMLARLGSDEFAIVIDTLSADTAQAALQAERIAARVHKVLGEPHDTGDRPYLTRVSIGVSMFGNGEPEPDELLKRADAAMTQAKQTGRDKVHFFDAAMQEALEARVALKTSLRNAIPDQLRLVFQPQVDSRGSMLGAEALVRWHHPVNGVIWPDDFIPLAEESGLILPIGQWVLDTACRQITAWESHLVRRRLAISVNVSAQQFNQPDFVEQVLSSLERSGADPARLKLELTESMFVKDIDIVASKMELLRSHGVRFALDDFGTGFSSLTYLKGLPLDQLKIDQAFVRDLTTDPHSAAIVRTIIALGQSLGLDVTAEGVETAEEHTILSVLGCDEFQGNLFGLPMSAREFEVALELRGSST